MLLRISKKLRWHSWLDKNLTFNVMWKSSQKPNPLSVSRRGKFQSLSPKRSYGVHTSFYKTKIVVHSPKSPDKLGDFESFLPSLKSRAVSFPKEL